MIVSNRMLGVMLAMSVGSISEAHAQQMAQSTGDYPNRPIRIVTAEAGGSQDFATRILAPGLSSATGQPVVVDNRAAIIAIETVMKAAPDAYTMLSTGISFWIQPLLQKASWDPVRNFTPITMAVSAPNILVVNPQVPAKSVKELIALARAEPGKLNYAAGAAGGVNHLAAELFKAMAGVNIVYVPYKGGAAQMNDLIGNQVQLSFGVLSTITPHVKSGRLRAVAVTSAQPSALAPGLPTVAASVPGYEVEGGIALLAPANTPLPIIRRLNREMVRLVNLAEMKEQFSRGGLDIVGSSPEELAAKIKSEMATMGKVIKDAGIRVE